MQILLCAATEIEIRPTILTLSQREGCTVQVLITGVGLLACSYALTKAIVVNRPDVIIQAGVAGTLNAENPLASVVAVRSECIGDLGVTEEGQFLTLFDLKLVSPETQPWQKGKLVNNNALMKTAALPLVEGVTVNEISTDENRIDFYRNSLQVQIESMEGAALHYVALLEKIPFLQVRSLSNFIGERDKKKWQLNDSITNLNHELQHILTKLEAI